jgi:hypothetical protein
MLSLADSRCAKSNTQLWIAGCSISHGLGVGTNERYGEILSNKLDMPVSFLTTPGASISWAADQILRSDIHSGDIVVWGLTSETRLSFMNNDGDILHITPTYYRKNPDFNNTISVDLLTYQNNNIFHYIRDIKKVINFCSKINANLILAGLLVNEELIKYVFDLPNYVHFYGVSGINFNEIFLDFGDDNSHPGPKTHMWYANELYKAII